MPESPTPTRPLVTGRWLVRLRWAAVLAQVTGVGVAVQVLGLLLPLGPIAVVIILLAVSNAALGWWVSRERPAEPRVLGLVLGFDVTLLTTLLWLTGGTSNPFTTVYLVYIALAAVTLGSRWTWTIAALSVAGYAVLFAISPAADPHAIHRPADELSGHLAGMWVAFLSAAILIGFFVTRVREALDERERALAEARQVAAAQERLASLTTLAAGAAHELATPLATIAVASKELLREAEASNNPALIEDAVLIRSQVERCRQILDHMSGRADASTADPAARQDPIAISDSAKRGEELFFSERTECFHCHGGFNLTETADYIGKGFLEIEFHNTGLYNLGGTGGYPEPNTGVHAVSEDEEDMGRFKAPSLRNIEVTAPYMHDGSIATLDEVIAHYEAGGRTIAGGPHAGDGSKSPLKSSFVKGFTLTPQERKDLVAFLKNLTDEEFLTDPQFGNPWKK